VHWQRCEAEGLQYPQEVFEQVFRPLLLAAIYLVVVAVFSFWSDTQDSETYWASLIVKKFQNLKST
jgi:hypothetical protein